MNSYFSKFDGVGMYGPNLTHLPLRLEFYSRVSQASKTLDEAAEQVQTLLGRNLETVLLGAMPLDLKMCFVGLMTCHAQYIAKTNVSTDKVPSDTVATYSVAMEKLAAVDALHNDIQQVVLEPRLQGELSSNELRKLEEELSQRRNFIDTMTRTALLRMMDRKTSPNLLEVVRDDTRTRREATAPRLKKFVELLRAVKSVALARMKFRLPRDTSAIPLLVDTVLEKPDAYFTHPVPESATRAYDRLLKCMQLELSKEALIKDLKKCPQHNGERCKILSFDRGSVRYQVRMFSGEGMRCPPENLTIID